MQMQRGAQTSSRFNGIRGLADAEGIAARTQPPNGNKSALPYHPAFGGSVFFTSEPRPDNADDETQTEQTIRRMLEYSSADTWDPIVQATTYRATAGSLGDPRRQLAGIFDWLRSNVAYVEDKTLAFFRPIPEDAEVLVRPADLVRMPQPLGDCDEFSMMARAMCGCLGIPAAFTTVEADTDAPGAYSHVYVTAYPPAGSSVAVDAIPTGHGLGWEVEPTGKRRIWQSTENPMIRTLARLQGRTLGALGDDATTLDFPFLDPSGGGGSLGPPAGFTDWFDSLSNSPNWSPVGGSSGGGSGSGSGFNFTSFANNLTNDASKILGTRYAVPQLNAGQVIRQADGTLLYQGAPGQAAPNIFGSATSSGLIVVVLIIGAVALFAAKGK